MTRKLIVQLTADIKEIEQQLTKLTAIKSNPCHVITIGNQTLSLAPPSYYTLRGQLADLYYRLAAAHEQLQHFNQSVSFYRQAFHLTGHPQAAARLGFTPNRLSTISQDTPPSNINNSLSPQALINIGYQYFAGIGKAQSYRAAYQYFSAAYSKVEAAQDFEVHDILGYMIYHGLGVEQDKKLGAKFRFLAAEQNYLPAMSYFGERFFCREFSTKPDAAHIQCAKARAVRAAEQGFGLALHLVASALQNANARGDGAPVNQIKAVLEAAVSCQSQASFYPLGLMNLGHRAPVGDYVKCSAYHDIPAAIDCFEKAGPESASALYELGRIMAGLYVSNISSEDPLCKAFRYDITKAHDYFLAAAKLGHTEAQIALAKIQMTKAEHANHPLAQDAHSTLFWLRSALASNPNHTQARKLLNTLHQQGVQTTSSAESPEQYRMDFIFYGASHAFTLLEKCAEAHKDDYNLQYHYNMSRPVTNELTAFILSNPRTFLHALKEDTILTNRDKKPYYEHVIESCLQVELDNFLRQELSPLMRRSGDRFFEETHSPLTLQNILDQLKRVAESGSTLSKYENILQYLSSLTKAHPHLQSGVDEACRQFEEIYPDLLGIKASLAVSSPAVDTPEASKLDEQTAQPEQGPTSSLRTAAMSWLGSR